MIQSFNYIKNLNFLIINKIINLIIITLSYKNIYKCIYCKLLLLLKVSKLFLLFIFSKKLILLLKLRF